VSASADGQAARGTSAVVSGQCCDDSTQHWYVRDATNGGGGAFATAGTVTLSVADDHLSGTFEADFTSGPIKGTFAVGIQTVDEEAGPTAKPTGSCTF
jgi:hypothetical protein